MQVPGLLFSQIFGSRPRSPPNDRPTYIWGAASDNRPKGQKTHLKFAIWKMIITQLIFIVEDCIFFFFFLETLGKDESDANGFYSFQWIIHIYQDE